MKLTLALFGLIAASALGQNPHVVLLPPELKSRESELISYLREKPGFKADIEKIFLDLKNAMDADSYPTDGNSNGEVSVDEAKRQILRLPSNRVEFAGKLAEVQDAARGKILGWEDKYPDGRPGDGIYDVNSAIRNRMQELGSKYAEEFGRISRHFEDYRKNVIAHANDPASLPQFDPYSPENRRYAKTVLPKKKAEFEEVIRTRAAEEKKLAQKPAGPADLLLFSWHLVTTDPSIVRK